jgi:cell division protein FtsI (penicillin-binding protein 3)
MRDLKTMQVVESPSKWMRLRVAMMGAIFFTLMVAVFGRAVELQVHQRARLKGFAEDQYVRATQIAARRGDIYDRQKIPLAQSVDVDSIKVDPSVIENPKLAARQLAKALKLDFPEVYHRIQNGRRFAWIKRQVTFAEVEKVKALKIEGLGFEKEPKRYYPQRDLAAHLVGLVGTDSHGLDGLEKSFDEELSGDRVRRESFRDARGRKLLTEGIEDPSTRRGASVTLTIDRQIQYLTEKALDKAVLESKAAAGMAVVMDPTTGEVLAVANVPRFNPNLPHEMQRDALRNRSITDVFEPGSTFKAFVVAAALEEKAITEETAFDCEKGSFPIGKHVVHDTHPHGILKAREILQVSSNIGAAKIAQKLGREKLVESYAKFGFGERAGLGLPGEGKGMIPFPRAEITLATESFGQGVSATALQVAAAYSALANKGVLMKPYVVSKVVDADGLTLLENKPTILRRVVSEKNARTVVSMLESVVEPGGTAPKARMDEYRVAGKTGTAQKIDPVAGGYSEKRVASFIGLVPAENPRLVALVVIDEPKTDVYGGLVAAPAFQEIVSQVLPMLGVPRSREAVAKSGPKSKDQRTAAIAEAESAPFEKSPTAAAIEKLEIAAITEELSDESVRVPDVKGLPARVALKELMGADLEPRFLGSGSVVQQSPKPGTVVEKGSRIKLELAVAVTPL